MQSLSVVLDVTKFLNFWWKKYWYQQNVRGVSNDLYLFCIFFRKCITVSSFIIVGCMWQILRGGGLFGSSPPIVEQPWRGPTWIGLSSFKTKIWIFVLDFCRFLIDKERLSSVVVGVVNFLVDKPIDFHDTTFLVSPSLFKV